MTDQDRKPVILHVDDSRSFLEMFDYTFSKSFDITGVESVDEALEKLKKSSFDALITDYEMPGKNGIQLMCQAREIQPGMPVVFITAQGNEEVAREVFISGASYYFTKKLKGFAQRERIVSSISNLANKYRAENALVESQNQYRAVFETSGSGMMLFNSDGRVLLANRMMKKLVGLQRLGSSREIRWQDIVEAGDRQLFRGNIKRLPDGPTEQAVTFECRLKTPGGCGTFLASASRVTGSSLVVVSFLDISHRIEIENQLRQEWALLEKIIQLNPYCVGIFDRDGHFVKANRQYEKLFPVLPPPEYCLFEDPVFLSAGMGPQLNALKNGETVELEGLWYNIRDIDPTQPDHRFFMKSTGFPIMDESGCLEFVVAILEDFTSQRMEEDRLRDSRRELEELVAGRTRELEKINQELRRQMDEKLKIQDALSRSERQHRLISGLAPVGIMVHNREKVVYLNRQGALLLGEEDPGRFIGKSVLSLVHPDTRDELKEIIDGIFNSWDIPRRFRYRLKRLDSTERIIEMSAARMNLDEGDFLLVISYDVADGQLSPWGCEAGNMDVM